MGQMVFKLHNPYIQVSETASLSVEDEWIDEASLKYFSRLASFRK